jgi:hypothetical protein
MAFGLPSPDARWVLFATYLQWRLFARQRSVKLNARLDVHMA